MWPFKDRRTAPIIPPTPPAPSKTGTVILNLRQIGTLIPALSKPLFIVLDPFSIAMIYDTLRNSAIVPPSPWPQVPHQFDHIINLPTDNGRYVTYFVFYPI